MSKLLNGLLASTPLSANFREPARVELPTHSDEPLATGSGKELDLDAPPSEKCELKIEGMTCGACVESIEGMLRPQAGIHSIKVALLAERGTVEYDPALWNPDKLVEEISDIGFDATFIPPPKEDTVTFRVYGMTCANCQANLESGLSAVPGVLSATASFPLNNAVVHFDRTLVAPRDLVEPISDMGFDAVLSSATDPTQVQSLTRAKEVKEWRSRFLWALAFAGPVFLISMVLSHVPYICDVLHWRIFNGIFLDQLFLFALTTPAQFWVGAKFYRNAFKSLKHRTATMDVLVMLGTSAAYFYSVGALFCAIFNTDPMFRPALFFDTSTMLIMFVSLGRYMENRAKGKTSAALTDLMALTPTMATIYTDAPACTQEKRIATELVEVGDTVKIVPGEKIPADGTVLRGASSIDESAITGEAIPVLKQIGDTVIGGTINGQGTIDMTVTRAGANTALAQIVKLVEEAQTSKAPIQAFADRVAGYFVPTVISLAGLTFIAWVILTLCLRDDMLPEMFHKHGSSKFAVCLQMCISVVVVACPCALGLSTPTAIMVGTGMGAKNGILIKGGRALESSRLLKRVVLDKTGTVTEGKLSVVGVCWAGDENREVYAGDGSLEGFCADGMTLKRQVMALVSATESRSEHPLAKAIATYGSESLKGNDAKEPEITSFESVTGAGVKATLTLDNVKFNLLVGNSKFILGNEMGSMPSVLVGFEDQETKLGRTIIYVAVQRVGSSFSILPVLAVSLADAPKKSSKYAIQSLRKMGIQVNMMTGDGEATALAVAKQVGISAEGVWASMTPKGKASKVTELIEQYKEGVAMVGDGINDSPALVAATVGIALSTGTSVAVEAADVVLMRSDLLDVVAAIHLSRKIYSVIRRNLIWACLYNILGIPLAMGFFLPLGLYMHPMLAGAAMAFSSVSVVTSSLTLKWWRRPADSVMPEEALPAEGSIFGSVSSTAEGLWSSVFRSSTRRDGYSQLPVEMSATTSAA